MPQLLRRTAADKRDVTRLQPHTSRQSTQVSLDLKSVSIAATHYLTSWANHDTSGPSSILVLLLVRCPLG
jgi:hypothetical protein